MLLPETPIPLTMHFVIFAVLGTFGDLSQFVKGGVLGDLVPSGMCSGCNKEVVIWFGREWFGNASVFVVMVYEYFFLMLICFLLLVVTLRLAIWRNRCAK